MADPRKNIVFDVVGTLVTYDALFDAIETRLGARLRAEGIKPRLLGYTWLEAAEREYTYLSLSARYRQFRAVFAALFYRMLWQAGIPEPRAFASADDLAAILDGYQQLELRPGARECLARLRAAGFTVWAFTSGDRARVGGYLRRGGVELPAAHLLSCDARGVGKPAVEAYAPLVARFRDAGDDAPWFAAAHMWDVSAARTTGFKGAYCTVWEKEPLLEIFGDMEVIADTLPEMADKVISAAGSLAPQGARDAHGDGG